MRRLAVLVGAVLALGAAPAAQAEIYTDGPVQARVQPTWVELSNTQGIRRWTRTAFRTEKLVDRRGGGRAVEHRVA